MRIPFLQATIVPVILGGVIAFQVAHAFNLVTFLLTLLGASLIQIATNMFNDYFDFKSGNDLQVKHQNPFAGGGRILTAGLVKLTTHMLIAAVLWINEFPDMDADNAVGKKTLVLRLGYARSISVYVGMVVTAYILIILYALLEIFSPGITSLTSLIALLSLPFAAKAIKILQANYKNPHAIIPANANTIFLHLSFGDLAILGFALGATLGL